MSRDIRRRRGGNRSQSLEIDLRALGKYPKKFLVVGSREIWRKSENFG
jgi:hypothetical protein